MNEPEYYHCCQTPSWTDHVAENHEQENHRIENARRMYADRWRTGYRGDDRDKYCVSCEVLLPYEGDDRKDTRGSFKKYTSSWTTKQGRVVIEHGR